MARINENPNICAFLDMIAHSEIGPALLAASDDGYNVIVGSTAANPILFDDYSKHPARLISPPVIAVPSTAAGRYQLLSKYFPVYRDQLGLPDFGPESQDRIAIRLIKECKAYNLVIAGDIENAIVQCRSRWASLPGAGYGQHENKVKDLLNAYSAAGGSIQN